MNDQFRRFIVCVVAFAGMGFAVPANGTGAASQLVAPALTGTVVVRTSSTGYAAVRLATTARMPKLGSLADVVASDPTHLKAVALVAETPVPDGNGGGGVLRPTLIAPILPNGTGKPFSFYTQSAIANENVTQDVLPAGLYRLYVVASAPERVTWRLPLPVPHGTLTVRASHVAVVPVVLNTSGLVPAASELGQVVSAAGHAATSAQAEVWEFNFIKSSTREFQYGNFCIYSGDDAAAVATEPAPAPICDGTNLGGGDYGPLPNLTSGGFMLEIDRNHGVNSYLGSVVGVKFSISVVGQVQQSAAMLLWLNLA